MIEMLGVLAIVGVLSAGGIAGYSMAMQHYKTNSLIDKIQLIATQTRALYKGGDYTGVDIQDLLDSGRISDKTNPFGGDLNVNNDGRAGIFYIYPVVNNLPADTCVDLLLTDWGADGVFYGLKVDWSSGDDEYTYGKKNYPIESARAVSACKGANRNVALYFR
jgi:type II secretory pathway pseudopilin PulG